MKIESNNEVYAILVSGTPKDETEWFGEGSQPLQASRMSYKAGKEFKAHRHILNPRLIKRTQEAFVVISGVLEVKILDDNKMVIAQLRVYGGDALLLYKGWHIVKVLEDTVAYEIKAGSFDGYLSEEKEF